jgi:hypothetical protein
VADDFWQRVREHLAAHPREPLPPEPVVYTSGSVDEVVFADGGLLTIPAELRLFRYAD